MELVSSVSTTAPTVTTALFSAALGKSVRRQASAKLPHCGSLGREKPLPPSSAGVFSAVTTVKYSGTRIVSVSTISSAVSHQLTW